MICCSGGPLKLSKHFAGTTINLTASFRLELILGTPTSALNVVGSKLNSGGQTMKSNKQVIKELETEKSELSSKSIQGIDDYDAMVINLSKCQLISANALIAFSINYCPMCNRNLGED